MKYAKRLALIAPEALAAAKLAVNRGLDAAGFRTTLNNRLDVLAPLYAAETKMGKKFKAVRAGNGLKAAWHGVRSSSKMIAPSAAYAALLIVKPRSEMRRS